MIIFINDDSKNNNNGENELVFKFYYIFWGVIPLGIITYLIIMSSRVFALSEIKVLMEYKYISHIKLLIIYGIIGTIITIIIGIISSFIECNKINSSLDLKICRIKYNTDTTYLEHFKIWKDDITNNSAEIFLLLIGIIMNFFYRLYYFLIIKNLTEIHIIFSNLVYTFFLLWIGYIFIYNHEKESKYNKIFVISFYVVNLIIQIIVIFGFLIYLEMIELNFCNLNYNLKKTIIDRSIEDYELKSDNEEDIDSDVNDSIIFINT